MALPTLAVTPGTGATVNTLPPGGQAVGASSLPVIIASDQSSVPVLQSGTVGHDYSANTPTLPNVGSAFAASGPYASYVLVATVPASATRANADIENTSGAQIVVMRDDGTAASGSAPANASLIPLGGGSAVGAQGGSWTSTTFKGRLSIYAPLSTAFVTVMVD